MKKIFLIFILAVNLGVFGLAGSIAYNSLFGVNVEKINNKLSKSVREKNKAPVIPESKEVEETAVTPQGNESAQEQVKDKKPVIKRSAKFIIISEPAEAKVFVNGYLKGRTPTEVEVVSAEENTSCKLVLLKPGYKRWETDVVISRGDIRRYRAVLHEIE